MENAAKKEFRWAKFLKYYFEQNSGRATRLGVFENGHDYWIEDDLPLTGIDIDLSGAMPAIEIMLGEDFTHIIKDVKNVKINFSLDEINDGLDITDAGGKTTILRFED